MGAESTNDASSNTVFEGELEKQGNWMGSWNSRYIKLYPSGVLANLASRDDAPRAIFQLAGAKVAAMGGESTDASTFAFVVRLEGGKTIFLRTSSAQAREQWVQHIGSTAANATAAAEAKKIEAEKIKAAEVAVAEAAKAGQAERKSSASGSRRSRSERLSVDEFSADHTMMDTPRTKAVTQAAMEKALGEELASVRSQIEAARANLEDKEHSLAQQTEALVAMRAEKETRASNLAVKLEAVGGQVATLAQFEGELNALRSEMDRQPVVTTREAANHVQQRLLVEQAESVERVQNVKSKILALEKAAKVAESNGVLAREQALAAREAAESALAAVEARLEVNQEQKAPLQRELKKAEKERDLVAKKLAGKEKLAAVANEQAAALKAKLQASDSEAATLMEREQALSRGDTAAAAAAEASSGSLVAGAVFGAKLAAIQSRYLASMGEKGDSVLSAEVAQATALEATLRKDAANAARTEAQRKDERQAELRQLRAKIQAVKAVRERKAAHAALQLKEARGLNPEQLACEMRSWSERTRVLAADLQDHEAREAQLRQAVAAAKAGLQQKQAAVAALEQELAQASAARSNEMAAEQRVLGQQMAHVAHVQMAVDGHSMAVGEEDVLTQVEGLAASTAAGYGERRSDLEKEQRALELELEELEERHRTDEALANSELASLRADFGHYRAVVSQLEAHERMFMGSPAVVTAAA
eukprot:CAMPEP_0119352946 /NCGR_PEP_ID=MMETSP1334-20130426/2155_1 /TAXON_ID=127549 /ORGANISM="Calcidiscus leptoporus, Strain RCC1130" /LENGTH=706 /DNA_ID=CAMNT_0007366101 /DNA_START=93 /DNA_END=2213 /DNA_ORIENTATION=-